ncbi:MAG: glycosyltransferase family 4 protein [Anaerolineae bacterium]|nr:MAG: glycosyltransferase family 4 protein [Anaerolineae bacterium]
MTAYVLDARTATGHFPGIGRYVVSLARAMAALLEGDERLVLLLDPGRPSFWDLRTLDGQRLRVVDVPLSPFSLLQQWAVPRLLRRCQADLYHSPYYLMPYRPGVPALLTVYDLIPLLFREHVSFRAGLLFRWATALALRVAGHVLTPSEATRRDLLSVYRLTPEKVTSIPLAADPALRPRPAAEVETMRRKQGLPEGYVLYLGSNKPHKNLVRLVEAWARLQPQPYPLVVAGAWNPRYPEPRLRAEALGLRPSVLWLGPIPESDLPALYAGATAFVFPSLYEGFGLPTLEAMACGAPVVCARIPSLLEVGADAALYFDPTSVAAMADALKRALADPDLRADLRQRGLARAAQFSWERAAQETLCAYRQMLR